MISQMMPDGPRPASRERSTAPSVCPVRTNTPPLRARSGKTWPGTMKSSGRASGRVACRIVVARSSAETPRVTPCRASNDTVKAVPSGAVFLSTIIGRPNASMRSSAIGRQISPRPYFAMKLMASGVTFSAAMHRSPSFSRSSSSIRTIIRPARISSIAS